VGCFVSLSARVLEDPALLFACLLARQAFFGGFLENFLTSVLFFTCPAPFSVLFFF